MAGFAATPPCPTCGAANAAYATFCIECGEPLDAPGVGPREAGRTSAAAVVRPAAGAGASPRLRWEWWLGAALILGVLGFALLDWQHQEEQAALYHQGDRAAAARHWTAARTAFARLGDYRDARRRATNAATLVQQRDSSYQAAQDALRDNDLIAAYSALSQTLAIEPDYQDAPALFARTGQAVVQAALADTVYRRVSGGPPGLYARSTATGPERLLPGSDGQSRVWTATAGGRVVYDGPLNPTQLAPPSSPGSGTATARLADGRRLWLSTIGSADTPKPVRHHRPGR